LPQQPAPLADDPGDSFAALRLTQPVTRIGGGYETDVYVSSDHGLALKLKHSAGAPAAMLARARRLRQAADRFRSYLGPNHRLLTDYLIVPGAAGTGRVLAVQPFLANARPLDSVNRAGLSSATRVALATQLADLLERALACYKRTGTLPDLYGLGPHDAALARRWDPRWLLRTSWQLLAGQPLIAAHNLLMDAEGRVVLVDYDLLCHDCLICRLVYAARAILLLRDSRHVAALARP
jgi:hypothetical protein